MAISILDGNAFSIIGAGRNELKKQGRHDEISTFTAEMTSTESYDKLLQTFIKWFPNEEISI
jgi:hypothetical protein